MYGDILSIFKQIYLTSIASRKLMILAEALKTILPIIHGVI